MWKLPNAKQLLFLYKRLDRSLASDPDNYPSAYLLTYIPTYLPIYVSNELAVCYTPSRYVHLNSLFHHLYTIHINIALKKSPQIYN